MTPTVRLALAAGELVVATDGMEALRPQRQAVLDALEAIATEARRAGTVKQGPVHEGAGLKGIALILSRLGDG
jgi:hypothetical protein